MTLPPNLLRLIGSSAIAAWECKSDNWRNDRDLRLVAIKALFKEQIKHAFEKWGKEARAVVRIRWDAGNAHTFVAKVIEGKITYLDPQKNIIRDIDATLRECTDEQRKLWFMRIDNRRFTDAIVDAVQNTEG